MPEFRKKPVVIEASQWFALGDHPAVAPHPAVDGDETLCAYCGGYLVHHGWIETLEGGHRVCPGDWVIKGVKGEFYSCKPNVFAEIYEAVEEVMEP